MSLFRTKPLATLLKQLDEGGLKRTLGWPGLIALGIGAIIGAGLFARTPAAAAQNAGPGVTFPSSLRRSDARLRGCAMRSLRR